MSAEILSLISLISFIISGISFVLAVFFWFKFDIPTVIGDLTGRTARKSIARMRENTENSNKRTGKSMRSFSKQEIIVEDDQIGKKETITPKEEKTEGKPNIQPKENIDMKPETGILAANKAYAPENPETAYLGDEELTEPLDDMDATGVLVDEDATAPLRKMMTRTVRNDGGMKLVMIDEVMLIHTDEVI